MIVLQTSSQTLQAGLAGGVSTTPLDITVVYYDSVSQTSGDTQPRYASQESTVSSATVTTVCNAPGQGISRNILSVFGYNRDVTSATISFNKNLSNASTFYKKATLITGQTVWYENGFGWAVL